MLCSIAPAKGAESPSTTAGVVNQVVVTAPTHALTMLESRAHEKLAPNTTIAVRQKAWKSIVLKRRSAVPGTCESAWGISAATRKEESYRCRHRWHFAPPRRTAVLQQPTDSRQFRLRIRHSTRSAVVPFVSSGPWWRGQSCSRPPSSGLALRRPVLSAVGEDALSGSFLWSNGASAFAAASSRALDG